MDHHTLLQFDNTKPSWQSPLPYPLSFFSFVVGFWLLRCLLRTPHTQATTVIVCYGHFHDPSLQARPHSSHNLHDSIPCQESCLNHWTPTRIRPSRPPQCNMVRWPRHHLFPLTMHQQNTRHLRRCRRPYQHMHRRLCMVEVPFSHRRAYLTTISYQIRCLSGHHPVHGLPRTIRL